MASTRVIASCLSWYLKQKATKYPITKLDRSHFEQGFYSFIPVLLWLYIYCDWQSAGERERVVYQS